MREDTQYFEVDELESLRTVNNRIDGGGWDLLEVLKRRDPDNKECTIAVYVVGHREDARG